jgi:predicted RNase H-like HicB family nuclease
MIDNPIVFFLDDEDDTFIADVPDLKYCSAHGDTLEEALRENNIVMTLWLNVARERRDPLPILTRFPAGYRGRHDQLIRGTNKSATGVEL